MSLPVQTVPRGQTTTKKTLTANRAGSRNFRGHKLNSRTTPATPLHVFTLHKHADDKGAMITTCMLCVDDSITL